MQERLSLARKVINYYCYGAKWALGEGYLRFGKESVSPEEALIAPLTIEVEQPGKSLNIVSWNIQRGYQEDEVKEALQGLDFDILMLQESPIKSTGNFSQNLAIELGYASVFYPTMINQGQWLTDFSAFGQATLSRHPIINYEIIGLNKVYDWQQATQNKANSKRHALYTQIQVGEKTLGTYNLHLDPFTSPRGRLEQIKPALSHIEDVRDDGILIGGDLNLWLGKGESVIKALTSLGFDYLEKGNQSQKVNLLDLDHFMTRNLLNTSAALLKKTSGSDHKPVTINLSFSD